MNPQQRDRLLSLSGRLILVACLFVLFSLPGGAGTLAAVGSAGEPLTNGLIRWWPNPLEARDEITGVEGSVMGLLRPAETGVEDNAELSSQVSLRLRPAVTNEVFTIAFWVHLGGWRGFMRLVGQESEQFGWELHYLGGPRYAFFVSDDAVRPEDRSEYVLLDEQPWQHIVISRHATGTLTFWRDGSRKLEGKLMHPWPTNAECFTVGSPLRGGEEPFHGQLRDLRIYDRVLEEGEVARLHSAGLPHCIVKNTQARLAATRHDSAISFGEAVNTATRSWTHRRFTTEDGLPGNAVKAVLQARDGYLWVGTDEGLARFDGRTFRQFTAANTPALASVGQAIWSLSEDNDGTIWAGAFGGLLRVRNSEVTGFTNGLPQRFILQAEPAGDGSVWIGAFNSGLPRGPLRMRHYYPDSGRTTAETTVPGHLRRMVVATNGLWLATEQYARLLFWDTRSPAPTIVAVLDTIPNTLALGSDALPTGTKVTAWKNGVAPEDWWAAVSLGSPGLVFASLSDHRLAGKLWVNRWTGRAALDEQWFGASYELARLRGSELERIPIANTAASPEITCLAGNREGGVWFGSEEGGLHLVQEKLVHMLTTEDGLRANDVRALAVAPDHKTLFVTSYGGLNRVTGGRAHSLGEPLGNCRSVAVDSEGTPWFSRGEFGPTALRRDEAHRERYLVNVGLDWQDPNTIRVARDGALWVVCERGLTRIQPRSLLRGTNFVWAPDPNAGEPPFQRYSVAQELPKVFPLGLVEDNDGTIWLGSLDGGGLFHLQNAQFRRFGREEGLPGKHWTPALVDRSGCLWVTTDAGLARRRDGKFQKIGREAGLPADWLLDMISDDIGNFWITGKRGIYRLSQAEVQDYFEGKTNHIRLLTLGPRDGLLTPECSSQHYPTMARTLDGHIWVATHNGVATFDPGRIYLNTQPLRTAIDSLLTRKGSVESLAATEKLRLPPGSGERMEFRFSAVSLSAPEKIQFRYKLDGYDQDWSDPTDLRLAFYTNLRPGEYRFRVKACNAHGIWNDDDTVLGFSIVPFFWQTRWFYLFLTLAIMGAALLVHSRRLDLQKRAQEMRLQRAFLDEKERIAADMHDDLGAALTQIVIMGEVGKAAAAKGADTYAVLDRISQAGRDVTTAMSELVWATNPRNDTLETLVAHLRELAARQLHDAPVNAELDFQTAVPDDHVSATVRRNIVLILREALTNVLKHSKATKVLVSVREEGRALLLKVSDNGRGFTTKTTVNSGNGLRNMAKRCADLGGRFSLRSDEKNGTTIEVSVPLEGSAST